jgi:hypothetical protein
MSLICRPKAIGHQAALGTVLDQRLVADQAYRAFSFARRNNLAAAEVDRRAAVLFEAVIVGFEAVSDTWMRPFEAADRTLINAVFRLLRHYRDSLWGPQVHRDPELLVALYADEEGLVDGPPLFFAEPVLPLVVVPEVAADVDL